MKGIHIDNLTETDHASKPFCILVSKLVSIKTKNQIAYPSKSSLIREDLCYSKVAFDNNPNFPETDQGSVHLGIFASKNLATKKSAFTLAEVLITLGIIGIVAALTLPTLIEKHQKKVTAKKLAVTYSIVANAFERAKSDYGDMSSWEVKKDGSNDEISEAYIDKYFLPYFDNYKKTGWGAFYWYYNNPTYGGNGGYFVEFKNGVTLTFAFSGNRDKDGNLFFNTPYFHVDINGKSKPNLVGKDIFKFMISDEKVVSGNYIDLPNSIVVEACRNREADACTELIFRNGWEFPDDYPW